MRQRIVGAIGISCEPRLLIADEPTTSLDLTIQAQYLNLLRELQRAHGLALIFITHNLGIVAKMCDQLAVMYAGRVVESGPVRQIFNAPAHPYTQALLNSIPRMSDNRQRLTAIDGQPPDLVRAAARLRLRSAMPERASIAVGRRRRRSSLSAINVRCAAGSQTPAPAPPTAGCGKEPLDGRARGGRTEQALPCPARVLRRRPRHGARGR